MQHFLQKSVLLLLLSPHVASALQGLPSRTAESLQVICVDMRRKQMH